MRTRLAAWAPLLILAALLALWLKDAIQSEVIAPAAYLVWLAGLYLGTVSTSVYWSALLGLVALIVLASLLGGLRFRRRAKEEGVRVQGPVEQAAGLVRERRRGPYFRWLVARRVGELARATLMAPDAAATSAPALQGSGWAPPAGVQAFLEAGLERPPLGRMRRGRSLRRSHTLLDTADVEQVIEYLESQMEMRE